MNIISLFSGIGAFEKALNDIDIPYDLINYCEIDKYASKSYSLLHNVDESKNLRDITTVNEKELPTNIDLLTYGFPCQDISISGKQNGFFKEDGTKTRSGLFFDALRIIKHTKPRVAIAENVKALTSKKFKKEFDIVLQSLEESGYNNYYQILNARDYGMPQKRARIFIVSIRKDIDDKKFCFPMKKKLMLTLDDFLEKEVLPKYFLSEKVQTRFKLTDETMTKDIVGTTAPPFRTIGQRDLTYQRKSVMGSLVATDYKQPKQIITFYDSPEETPMKTYSYNGQFYYNIRKMTPLEGFLIMGFSRSDYELLHNNSISDMQLYKQVGNSICVPVLTNLLILLKKYWNI